MLAGQFGAFGAEISLHGHISCKNHACRPVWRVWRVWRVFSWHRDCAEINKAPKSAYTAKFHAKIMLAGQFGAFGVGHFCGVTVLEDYLFIEDEEFLRMHNQCNEGFCKTLSKSSTIFTACLLCGELRFETLDLHEQVLLVVSSAFAITL